MGCRGVLNGRESTTVSILEDGDLTGENKNRSNTNNAAAATKTSSSSTTTTTSTTTVVEDIDGEKLEIKSSVTALGVMTALCTLGGCAMLFNPSEAFASTTQHILELAESNADALDPETAKTIAGFLGPLFAISEILFIVRIVMTWYPSVPITKLPWVVAYVPTEPLLKPTRTAIPPVGGVDVSPIVWVGVISFFNEILLGKQGLLVLLSNKTMA